MFGYTGVASLVAARAGADVTHVDASKKASSAAKNRAGYRAYGQDQARKKAKLVDG